MAITLTTDEVAGDQSLHGFGTGESTTSANFTEAKNNMEADSWTSDSYALMQAGFYVYGYWRGIGHLMQDVSTGHIRNKSATGHLLRDGDEAAGECRCIAILDRAPVAVSDQGTAVTSIKFKFSALVQYVSSVPVGGYKAQIYFKTTDSDSPDGGWGWLDYAPYKDVVFSKTTAATDITLSGITGFTLASQFYCCYKLSSYSFPTYDDQNLTKVGAYYTKDIKVTFGLDNTYYINP